MEQPWNIDWFICRADHRDVEYERTRKLKRGEQRQDRQIGDELWRVPRAIGPISIEHDHWSEGHLGLDDDTAVLVAHTPCMVDTLKQIRGLATSPSPIARSAIYELTTNLLAAIGELPPKE